MSELIKIIEKEDGRRTVSARELHLFLESKRDFSHWMKDRIVKYGLIENIDYQVLHYDYLGNLLNIRRDKFVESENQHVSKIEYVLSIDAAKELSMVEGNEKGKEARRYFIACEKIALEKKTSYSPAELLLHSAQILLEQERRTKAIENKVNQIEERTITDLKHSTVVAYVTRNKICLDFKRYSVIGGKASRLCKKRGLHISKVNDVRFGTVNVYPDEILDEVFATENNQFKSKEK